MFSCCSGAIYAGEALRVVATHNASVRKTPLFAPFIHKTIILPRQARDKHRESAQKQTRFSQEPLFLYVAWQINHTPLQVPAAYLARFSHINDTRRKTYSAMTSFVDEGISNLTAALKVHENLPLLNGTESSISV